MAVQADVEDLEQLPQRELVRLARGRGIRGSSRMRKAELIEALRRQDPREGADPATAARAEAARRSAAAARAASREHDRQRSALAGAAALALVAVVVVALVLVLRLDGGAGSDVGDTKSAGATTYRLVNVTTQDALGAVQARDGSFVVADLELTAPSGLRPFAPVAPAALLGGDGVTYEPSAEAAAALGQDSLAAKQVRPGAPTAGKIAFDLPPAALPDSKLLLRDLAGSSQAVFDTGL